jgi:YVTN family beta-propeller protein
MEGSVHRTRGSRRFGRLVIAAISCGTALVATLHGPSTAAADTSRLITRFYQLQGANAVLFNRTGKLLYLPTMHAVDVVSLPKLTFVDSIKTSEVPRSGAALSPDGKRMYLSSDLEDRITLVDLVKRRTISTIRTCGVVDSLAVSPNGKRVYLACTNDAALEVVDPKARKVTNKILTGLLPGSVALTADGSRAFVTNGKSASVSVIDTKTDKEITTIPTGQGPNTIAITPDGSRLYVSCSDEVWVIDVASKTPVAKVPVPRAIDVALSADGTRLFVAAHGVGVIDTSTNTLIGTISLQNRDSFDIAVTPDGRRVAAVVQNYVYLVDVAGYAG